MLRKLRERTQSESGFTLIELLVVVLIIGILAAIAVPSFINQRGKAQGGVAKSDAKTAQTAMETYYTDNETYVGATPAALVAIEPSLNNANVLATTGALATYTVTVTSKSSDAVTFTIVRAANGTITRTCSTVGKDGCKAADAQGNMW